MDAFYGPRWFVNAVQPPVLRVGGMQRDTPFSGTCVSLGCYGHERQITSNMLELRRNVYGWGDRSARVGDSERVSERLGVIGHGD